MNIDKKIEKLKRELNVQLNIKARLSEKEEIKEEKKEIEKDIKHIKKIPMSEKLNYIEVALQYVGDLPSDYHFDRYLEKSKLIINELKNEWDFEG